jgi:hypothetical protein
MYLSKTNSIFLVDFRVAPKTGPGPKSGLFFKSGQIRPRPDLVAGFTHSFLSAQAERVLTATGRKFSFCKMVLIVLPTLPAN